MSALRSSKSHRNWPSIHTDNSTVVLNVNDDARVGKEMVSARGHQYLASDSVNNALLQWFELLLGTCWSLLWPTL